MSGMLDFEKRGSEYAVTSSSIRFMSDKMLKQMEKEFQGELRKLYDKKEYTGHDEERWTERLHWIEFLKENPALVEVGFMLFTSLGRSNVALQGEDWVF